jgi:hypothetical protein
MSKLIAAILLLFLFPVQQQQTPGETCLKGCSIQKNGVNIEEIKMQGVEKTEK